MSELLEEEKKMKVKGRTFVYCILYGNYRKKGERNE